MSGRAILALVSWLWLLNAPATAQDSQPTDTAPKNDAAETAAVSVKTADGAEADAATHAELRKLRDTLTKAVEDGDVDQQLACADKNVVTTWQNNQVAIGPDGLRNFLKEMDGGDTRVFQGYKVPPTADQPATIYGGDMAIAVGKSVPHYKYLGMEFDLENRWTATLVKENDQWKVAAYHVSSNIVDNPLLAAAKRALYWTGGLALLVGLVLGNLAARMMNKKRAAVV